MRLQKKFNRRFKGIKTKLCLRYGDEICLEVEKNTFESYSKIQPTLSKYKGLFNFFNTIMDFNVIFISLYLAMKKLKLTAKETVGICYEVAEEKHLSIPRPIRWLMHYIFFSFPFLLFLQNSSKNVEKCGAWEIKYFKGDGLAFDMGFECKKCGVVEFLKENGGEELIKYCNFMDYIQSRTFGLGWQNPVNIGQGGGSCISYMKRNRTTEIPVNLSDLIEIQSCHHHTSG